MKKRGMGMETWRRGMGEEGGEREEGGDLDELFSCETLACSTPRRSKSTSSP